MKNGVPAIVIYCSNNDQFALKEVKAGVEEEGLSCQVLSLENETDPITMAYEACRVSVLGVGIGIYGQKVRWSVREHLTPVLMYDSKSPRNIGQNSARYVKKLYLR